MTERLTQETMKKVVTSPQVFNHLIKLQEELKREFSICKEEYSQGVIQAIQEAPNTTLWIKNIVIPKMHDGDEGLDEILLDIEKESNILLSATKMQMVLDILQTLPESLNELKEGVEEGEYNIQENIQNFSDNIPFTTYH